MSTPSAAFTPASDAPGANLFAPQDPTPHGLWYWYRNARAWGKPVLWSVRYAREARRRFK